MSTTMKETRIKIHCHGDQWRFARGLALDGTPLVIHLGDSMFDWEWGVSHRGCGLRYPVTFPHRRDAVRFAKAIARYAPDAMKRKGKEAIIAATPKWVVKWMKAMVEKEKYIDPRVMREPDTKGQP